MGVVPVPVGVGVGLVVEGDGEGEEWGEEAAGLSVALAVGADDLTAFGLDEAAGWMTPSGWTTLPGWWTLGDWTFRSVTAWPKPVAWQP